MIEGIKYPKHKLIPLFVKGDLIIFGRYIASFEKLQPLYSGIRRTYSNPTILTAIAKEVARMAKRLKVDLIGGCESAGIPLSSAVSVVGRMSAVYLKKTKKAHGTRELIEGSYKSGQSILVVDDAIGDGRSKKIFVQNCIKAGLKVKGVLVILDCAVSVNPYFKKHHIPIYSLVSHPDLMRAYYRAGKINRELFNLVKNFFTEIDNWSGKGSQELWRKFYKEAKQSKVKLEICA